ncbi:hypothetical protein IX51_02430 [uncultured archaeon]|nr:hypothetical protein IX51_02430 [uncultured archaeon]
MEGIGFIGLGKMGVPILKNIMRKHQVLGVYNRTATRAQPYAALDMKIFRDPWEVAARCDIIFLMLSDSKAVNEVMHGKKGILGNLGTGKIVVDLSTIHPDDSVRIAAEVRERNAEFIDSPVIGSVPVAEKGELVTVAGGSREAFDAVKPILESFSNRIFYMGLNGSGLKMKLVNNLLMGANLAVLSESLLFGEKLGIPREKQIEILSSGAASSKILELKKEPLLNEDFLPQFLLSHEYKDLNYALDLARSSREPVPISGAIVQFYAAAMSIGLGNLDFSSVLRAFKALRGMS